jgi:hypothetical protein
LAQSPQFHKINKVILIRRPGQNAEAKTAQNSREFVILNTATRKVGRTTRAREAGVSESEFMTCDDFGCQRRTDHHLKLEQHLKGSGFGAQSAAANDPHKTLLIRHHSNCSIRSFMGSSGKEHGISSSTQAVDEAYNSIVLACPLWPGGGYIQHLLTWLGMSVVNDLKASGVIMSDIEINIVSK